VLAARTRLGMPLRMLTDGDLVHAATRLSGAEPRSAEPPRRRLRWRP
jgi:hypothetical protein